MSYRFTEHAQSVISLAQEEAKRWQNNTVEPLHILAGIIAHGEGLACQLLAKSGLSHSVVKERGLTLVPPSSKTSLIGEIPFSFPSKKVLEFAVEEAQGLGHGFVGTEHLLLGLLHVESSSNLLKERGLVLEKSREDVLALAGKGWAPPNSQEIWTLSNLGPQLMNISVAYNIRGVLITAEPGASKEPAIIILVKEGTDLDMTHQLLKPLLPKVRYLYFKKPNQHPVRWTGEQWKENPEAATTLTF